MRTPQTDGEWDLYYDSLPSIHVIVSPDDVNEELYAYYDDEKGRHFLTTDTYKEYRLQTKDGKFHEVEN